LTRFGQADRFKHIGLAIQSIVEVSRGDRLGVVRVGGVGVAGSKVCKIIIQIILIAGLAEMLTVVGSAASVISWRRLRPV